jgi:hypothetical protein
MSARLASEALDAPPSAKRQKRVWPGLIQALPIDLLAHAISFLSWTDVTGDQRSVRQVIADHRDDERRRMLQHWRSEIFFIVRMDRRFTLYGLGDQWRSTMTIDGEPHPLPCRLRRPCPCRDAWSLELDDTRIVETRNVLVQQDTEGRYKRHNDAGPAIAQTIYSADRVLHTKEWRQRGRRCHKGDKPSTLRIVTEPTSPWRLTLELWQDEEARIFRSSGPSARVVEHNGVGVETELLAWIENDRIVRTEGDRRLFNIIPRYYRDGYARV